MRKFFKNSCLGLFIALLSTSVYANNLRITDVVLTNDSTLTFNISWENSWRVTRTPGNHDAVWIFIKERPCGSVRWRHTDLLATSTAHTGSGLLEVYVDGKDQGEFAKGVFVRRRAVGSGDIENQTISLRLARSGNELVEFHVMGIEMVQIPEGAFYLGDGSTNPITTNAFKKGNTSEAFKVESEDAIAVGNTAANVLNAHGLAPLALPADYPKGFREIYCMKYEITQQQYVDFLNLLSSDHAALRFLAINDVTKGVNYSVTNGVYATTFPHRAAGNITWPDLLAYLDWSCLRPMTELEYEKICRGPHVPLAGEYVWGTTGVTSVVDVLTVQDAGTATETSSNVLAANQGIAQYNVAGGVTHLMRSGFAAKEGTNRANAGATYYGVLEMAGNAIEMVVTSAHAKGVAFKGTLGNGELGIVGTTAAVADNADWPSSTGGSADGRGVRGGHVDGTINELRASDRTNAVFHDSSRRIYGGGRGVR